MRRTSALTTIVVLVVVLILLAVHLQSLGDFVRPRLDVEPWKPALNLSLPLAAQTSAAHLLARPPRADSGRIPRIFHQSWKSTKLPSKFQTWSTICRQQHKDWEWVLWTDEDNLRLVQTYFPSLEAAYRDLPGEIYRADLARYLYMYIYGGVYADLDTECLRPTEDLQADYDAFFDGQGSTLLTDTALFGRMGNDAKFEHSIPNAWMASTPGHPFFLAFVHFFNDKVKELKQKRKKLPEAEHVTGPAALFAAINRYEQDKTRSGNRLNEDVAKMVHEGPFAHLPDRVHQVLLLPSHYIYPYSWGSDGSKVRNVCWVLSASFSSETCKKTLEVERMKSISITYWSHTHTPLGHNKGNMKHLEADS
ncbi:hypothetical protein G6O67_002487 [Ophiocordyceps sinensis]|uniref:Glycosyltransferase family 32 protein n=2 Tax=Ophiocordyceps sinensis TaxID=72228 RepID=A0A8H4PUB1_9HYPO|nr:glycosyltransferase family 32 protein [Ophiocordyceps sinensis CO18]KAF4510611.1 hypothetical protein G6O67_002487 [Ophiocordyceps sinensis]